MQPDKLDRVDGHMSCISLVIIYHLPCEDDFQVCVFFVHEQNLKQQLLHNQRSNNCITNNELSRGKLNETED